MPAPTSPSNTQVDRAGKILRQWVREPSIVHITEDVIGAYSVVEAFRRSFQKPLQKTTVGVRQFVKSESTSIVVAQRLKRFPRIVDKLHRFSHTRLSQMQDVGGCRAILYGGATEVQGVLRRIRRNWDVVEVDDYVSNPKPGGYRAVHAIVRRDGRLLEIQLRTPLQHEWAEAVERTEGRTRFKLKDGKGPGDLLRYFEMASEGMANDEARGPALGEDFVTEFNLLRLSVAGYFER